jgi:hypothetical protein
VDRIHVTRGLFEVLTAKQIQVARCLLVVTLRTDVVDVHGVIRLDQDTDQWWDL